MKTIWKYPLSSTLRTDIDVPPEAKVLTVQLQAGIPCLWMLVNPHTEIRHRRRFLVVGTGDEIDELPYIGTFQQPPLVWHVFEERLSDPV